MGPQPDNGAGHMANPGGGGAEGLKPNARPTRPFSGNARAREGQPAARAWAGSMPNHAPGAARHAHSSAIAAFV